MQRLVVILLGHFHSGRVIVGWQISDWFDHIGLLNLVVMITNLNHSAMPFRKKI